MIVSLLDMVSKAEDDVIRSGILEITDKQSVVLLSAIAMAMDLQEDAAPTDKQALAMEVSLCPCSWYCFISSKRFVL